jgi:hypothetical protein
MSNQSRLLIFLDIWVKPYIITKKCPLHYLCKNVFYKMSDTVTKKPVHFSLSNTKDYENAFLKIKFGSGRGQNDKFMVEGFGKLFAKRFDADCIKTSSDGMPGILEIKVTTKDSGQQEIPSLNNVSDIISIIEKNIRKNPKFSIYEIDDNSKAYVSTQIDRISNRIEAPNIKGGLSIITSDVFKRFLEGIKINEIIDFANKVHVALPTASEYKDVKAINLLKCGMFSAANCALAMFKWSHVLQRQGTPTFLLTENQWKRMYGLGIAQDAPPISLICPNQMGGYDPIFAKRESGMDRKDARRYGEAMLKAFEKLAMPFSDQSAFHMQVYYDFSDTVELTPGAKMNFYNDYIVNNVTGELNDKAQTLIPNNTATQQGLNVDDAIKQANDVVNNKLQKNDRNAELVWNAFKELAKEDPGTYGQLARARSIVDGLEKYFANFDFIDREKDTQIKQQKINYCVFETLVALMLDTDGIIEMFRREGAKLIDPSNYINIKSAVGEFVRDVERVNKAVTESKNEKYTIREGFVRLWNNIVEKTLNR